MNVMLLAAGLGTRFRPVTESIPKPAIPLLNVPLLGYTTHLVRALSIQRWVVNLHHLPDHVKAAAQRVIPTENEVVFSDETGLILGSGGGVSKAQSLLRRGESFLYANGDEVLLPRDPNVVTHMKMAHENDQNLATLMVVEHPLVGSKFGGIWTDALGNVKGFGKTPPEPRLKGWHFVGYQFLSESIFSFLRHDIEFNIFYDGMIKALKNGARVRVFPIEAKWFEVGNAQDYLSVTDQLLTLLEQEPHKPEGIYLQGVLKSLAPDSIFSVTPTTRLFKHKTALCEVETKGFCVLGRGTEIKSKGPASTLSNSVVFDSVKTTLTESLDEQILFR